MQREDCCFAALERLYETLVALLCFLSLPVLLLSRRTRSRLAERFGRWAPVENVRYWFHGASFGELQGLIPLIRWVRERHPERKVLVTATNPRAFSVVENEVDFVRLLPFDSAIFLRAALQGALPEQVIIAETEIWPGFLRFLHSRRIPVSVVNARMTSRSLRRYKLLASFFRNTLNYTGKILLSESESEKHFSELGVAKSKLKVTGNMKFERRPRFNEPELKQKIRTEYRIVRELVVVLGSIRPGEEIAWIEALRATNFLQHGALIVAPRHPEFFDFFTERFAELGVAVSRVSTPAIEPHEDLALIVLDRLGELEQMYAIAKLAFVGGTLDSKYGGHNLLEPAMYGCCIACGPFGESVARIRDELSSNAACVVIKNRNDIEALLVRLLGRDPELSHIGARGEALWRRHSGATERIVTELGWSES